MRFGVLTGGGDSPGTNDFLYFLALCLEKKGHDLVGFRRGWQGPVADDAQELQKVKLEDSRFTSGTVLGSARKNPIKDGELKVVLTHLERRGIDVLVAVGGDDTLGVAAHLSRAGVFVIGVPQTIDNDLVGTERCLGYATAINQAVRSVNSVVKSNLAHDQDMFVEVMGRDCGWLALATAIGTPACACLCPEGRMDLEEAFQAMERYRGATGKPGLAIVAEGLDLKGFQRRGQHRDAFGNVALAGVGAAVGERYQEQTGRRPRVLVLGHLTRGGTPVPADVELAALFAEQAVHLALEGKGGQMVALVKNRPAGEPLEAVIGARKKISPEFLDRQLHLLA